MKFKTLSLLLLTASSFAGTATYQFVNQSDQPHQLILATVKRFNPVTKRVEDFHVKSINVPAGGKRRSVSISGRIPVHNDYIYPVYFVRHLTHADGTQTNVHNEKENHLTLKCVIDRNHRSRCKTSR